MHELKTIIWDWNGTLLDDVDVCIESINILLGTRGHAQLSKGGYREIFTFPVKDYYEHAGFDFSLESFDDVAIEFIGLYREKIQSCTVFPHARAALDWFSTNGYSQYLVSAMEHQFLRESIHACGISHFFDGVSGVKDHLANGKAAMARDFIAEKGIDPVKSVFIGDTLHDYEVANALGMNCLLVADGHQSESRLARSGCEVLTDLSKLIGKFNNGAQRSKSVKK